MNLFMIGHGSHAVSLFAILTAMKLSIDGIIDISSKKNEETLIGKKKIPIIDEDKFLAKSSQHVSVLINGIGSIKSMVSRYKVFQKFKKLHYTFKTLVDPTAIISDSCTIGEGTQVMAGAIIQAGCNIGINAIVNTGAIIDHTCVVGNHVHVAPGVVLSGNVKIGNMSHIGTGATIIQGINIGSNVLIGAGAVVIHDIPDNAKALGVPAKIIR
jgi:UDP-perosamine 4-acetyltransferase